jgi:hypothetical protein
MSYEYDLSEMMSLMHIDWSKVPLTEELKAVQGN